MKQLVILVTGATAGIGRHAALELARRGHRVFAAGRRTAALRVLENENPNIEGVVLDVTNQASIDDAKETIARKTDGHGVDVVVNNAGWGLVGPLEELSDADLRAQFDTNVFGLMAVTRAFVPQMRERGFGRVINVSSMGGRITFPLMGAYHATKYAVEALSDALRIELGAFGISVSLIEPGAIRTEFTDVALTDIKRFEDGAYGAVLRNAKALEDQFMATAVGPEHTTRAIVKAVESKRPSARYIAPRRVAFVLAIFAILPTRWMDGLLRMAMRLTPKQLEAAT
jgi:short-subunit dehydrogenase